MSWNYRVLRSKYKRFDESGYYFNIHEVYYDKHNNIKYWSVDPIDPYGETLDEIKWDLEHMMVALEKPVLEFEESGILVEVKDETTNT